MGCNVWTANWLSNLEEAFKISAKYIGRVAGSFLQSLEVPSCCTGLLSGNA